MSVRMTTKPRGVGRSLPRTLTRIVIFTHDLDGDGRRIMRLQRKGAHAVQVVDSIARPGYRNLVATVRVGSEAEQFARRLEARGRELIRVGDAIRDGRAYLATAWGRRMVVAYDDRTGEATTTLTGQHYDRRTFTVTIEAIGIEPEGVVR